MTVMLAAGARAQRVELGQWPSLAVAVQVGEAEPFICELLKTLTTIIADLQSHQIHMFYEAVGLMIGAETDSKRRDAYLVSRHSHPPSQPTCGGAARLVLGTSVGAPCRSN